MSRCADADTYRFVFTFQESDNYTLETTLSPLTASKRLQLFDIAETDTFLFTFTGYYFYKIHQTTSNNVVETGLAFVYDDEVEAPAHINTQTPLVYG